MWSMKRVLLAVLVVGCLVAVTGCGSSTKDKIVGQWTGPNGSAIQFTHDGKATLTGAGQTVELSYTVDGNKVTLRGSSGTSDTYDVTWQSNDSFSWKHEGTSDPEVPYTRVK
jgi:hypothetical protein